MAQGLLIGLKKKLALAAAVAILVAAGMVTLVEYRREETHAARRAEAEAFARTMEGRFRGEGLTTVEQHLRGSGVQYRLGGRSHTDRVRDVWVELAHEPSLHWFCSTATFGATLEFDDHERLVEAIAGSWEQGCL